MITKENIEELLAVLKFTKDLSGTFGRRDFPIGCTLEVDVNGEKFYYEKAGITVTGATTANFSQNENFVVFECICRILEKGYTAKVWSDCMISSWYRFEGGWSRPVSEIDKQFYAKYGVTKSEQKFIESLIKPMV